MSETGTHPGRPAGLRAVAVAVVVAFAATMMGMLATAAGAGAATARGSSQKSDPLATTAESVPITGVADDNTVFAGDFALKRFKEKQGTLYAVGQLTGDLGGQVVDKQVSLPVTGAVGVPDTAVPGTGAGFRYQVGGPVCSILTLTLGPLDLNLLGLHVTLNQVELVIEAISGAGMLLGNLLCAVAGLLDGGLGGGLGGLLNGLLAAIADFLNDLLGL